MQQVDDSEIALGQYSCVWIACIDDDANHSPSEPTRKEIYYIVTLSADYLLNNKPWTSDFKTW